MSLLTRVAKRLVIGRPVSSDRLGDTTLSKRIALPIFASDALSSVTYATQEILLVLTVAGTAYLFVAPWVAAAIVLLFAIVVASYRQVVRAYPSGGGDYEVATKNLGRFAGLTVASALLVDYVLTVAVSVSAGVDNVISAFPGLNPVRVELAVVLVAVLAAANLRGLRESGTAFAIPTYGFAAGVMVLIVTGLIRLVFGSTPQAESAAWTVNPEPGHEHLAGLALLFFALRAFSSGCTALTGIEAIANGVPAFRPPKSRNAAITLGMLGLLAVTMFGGITALALVSDVHVAANTCDLIGFTGNCATDPQRTVIAQLGAAIFGGDHSVGFFYIQAVSALILVLAANTAFNGFPLLGSVLAQDRYLPRQLHTRGDRLVFSNGILVLAGFAMLLIWAFDASVTRLIQLYIIGVFTSFTLGQLGMVRHWNRNLRTEQDPGVRRRMMRSRVINATGGTVTAVVLVIVLIEKFLLGAWIVVIAMPVIFWIMKSINRHYTRVAEELVPDDERGMLPSRVHAIVLVSKLHKPTLRALAYAKATRPDTLTALTVNVDEQETRALQEEWDRRDIRLPLTIVESPYREITRPVLDFVKRQRRESPRDVVAVFVPEYVVGRWWEHLLHNQSALRLKGRLLFTPGVMVTSVPWQLASSARAAGRPERAQPGAARRGLDDRTRTSSEHPDQTPAPAPAPGANGRDPVRTAEARAGADADPRP
ncbi:MAG TPA: APC family permease [Mycobacteriales bacterium]|nr:APC family permease [Mycobacteriales bacterium]